MFKENNGRNGSTVVEFKSEYRSKVYCNFDYFKYPMDKDVCSLRFGSRGSSTIFVWYDLLTTQHVNSIQSYSADGFDVSTTFFDEQINNGTNTIGINMKMKHRLMSFVLKYYAPAMAIVLISEISFLIPITALPGRIGLLVTLFLTLTNVFIYQMVSKYFNS